MDLSATCCSKLSCPVCRIGDSPFVILPSNYVWVRNTWVGAVDVSLPVRFGGLGVGLPTMSADSMYAASRHAASIIVEAIVDGCSFKPSLHEDLVLVVQRHYQKQLDVNCDTLFSDICSELDPIHRHALQRSHDNVLSAWLSVMPTKKDNFDVTAQEFCNALAIRYKKPLLSIPPQCDGCGAPSPLDHF